MKVIAIVFACFTGTTASGNSSNLTYAGKGVWENVYSYLPLIERQLTFRKVRGLCDSIYREQNNLNGTLEMKRYLNEIHDHWDAWNAQTEQIRQNYIAEIHTLHCRLSTEEQYALQSPRIFRRWKDAMLWDSSVVPRSAVDQEARKEIVRRVFEAVRLSPFCVRHSAEDIDRLTLSLIQFSRDLSFELVASTASSQEIYELYPESHWWNHSDLKWMSLWYQHLWDHISARNGSLLPPRNTMFQIQNEAQSQYLNHLIADCGLAVIHPMYLDQFLGHKLYWRQMARAHDGMERDVRMNGGDRLPEESYKMFRLKYVLMAIRSMRCDGDGIDQFNRYRLQWSNCNEHWIYEALRYSTMDRNDDLAQQLSNELMYW